MPKQEPQRSCLGCRTQRDKGALLRFVIDPERFLVPDLLGKLPGRGAYTCYTSGCLRNAVTRKQFARSFHGEIRVGSADELVTNVRRLMEDRIASYIALANKAGQVISGSDAVAEALQHGQVGVVMMAADISADSAGRFTGLAQRNGTRIERVLDKERLGNLLGKELRSIVAVEKGRFAEVISRELEKYRNFCEGGADVR